MIINSENSKRVIQEEYTLEPQLPRLHQESNISHKNATVIPATTSHKQTFNKYFTLQGHSYLLHETESHAIQWDKPVNGYGQEVAAVPKSLKSTSFLWEEQPVRSSALSEKQEVIQADGPMLKTEAGWLSHLEIVIPVCLLNIIWFFIIRKVLSMKPL